MNHTKFLLMLILLIDFYSRRAKGYAYIEFGNPEEAEQAMSRIEVRHIGTPGRRFAI